MSMSTLRILYLTLLSISVIIDLALLIGTTDKRTRYQMEKLSLTLWVVATVLLIIHVIHRAPEQ